jgi:predicted nucleotidyltransferase
MNIHITDIELYKKLWSSTIFNMKMGSVLYGLGDKESDTDFISIIAPSVNQMNSFNKSIHQLQYKDDFHKVDYVFTDIYSFFWNLLNGDSTINFEVVHSDDFKNSEFGSLFKEIMPNLRTYSIIISYLGFANRDIKYFWREKTDREKIKKLIHIVRGFSFAKQIFYDYQNFKLVDENLLSRKRFLTELSGENLNDVCKSYLKSYSDEIKLFRQDVVNKALEKKELTRFLDVSSQKKLDEILLHLSKTPLFLNKQIQYIDLEPYYLVNENELKY